MCLLHECGLLPLLPGLHPVQPVVVVPHIVGPVPWLGDIEGWGVGVGDCVGVEYFCVVAALLDLEDGGYGVGADLEEDTCSVVMFYTKDYLISIVIISLVLLLKY